jgi:hypothetical protein
MGMIDAASDIVPLKTHGSNSRRRTPRLIIAIALITMLGPTSCQRMTGPVWGSTDDTLLNAWYDHTGVLAAFIFFIGPILLFLAGRLQRALSCGIIRQLLTSLQWTTVGIFLINLHNPWRQVIITDWQGKDFVVVEHPLFATCFYLSALLSGLLWVTFRGGQRWPLRAVCEFLPLVLLVCARFYLSSLDMPEYKWS